MSLALRVRNQKDFAAGLVYVAAGAGFSLGALDYKLGDPARMGPGWFPFWIGILLAVVGVVVAASAVRPHAQEEKVKRPDIAAMGRILGAVVLFGLLLVPAGLVAALTVLIVVASRASHEFTWRGALVAAILLNLFCIGTFVYGIHLQVALWPAFMR